MKMLKRTWAEVDLDALRHNYRILTRNLPEGCRFLGVVKADAYGHGAVPVALELQKLGAGYLAVSNVEEAYQLRQGGVTLPILILGYTPEEFAEAEADEHITQEVHCLSYARALSQALAGTDKHLKVHLKIDTGMSRLGFFGYDHPETLSDLEDVFRLPHLEVEGIFMHFAVADTPAEDGYTRLQHERFMEIVNGLRERGHEIPIVHCANSGATIGYPEYHHHMVRPGVATYGLSPSEEMAGMADLKPLMGLKTTIGAIRPFAPGITVSYGRTYETDGDRVLAVCPIGYADGLPRRLSGNVEFLLHGKAVPVVGRICMDMCMVDITSVPEARVGDTVTVIGRDGAMESTWDTWAEKLDTIHYELVCGINKRVPRIYLRDGKEVDHLQYIV